ncbi:2-hydroxy-6-oxohepta-2,4-dienoate hydrolase [Nitratiruptor sp. YY08-26]|uniref:alpha/beta fold hydrolase n=1 Tax=unclassified Nitratiruptor TaxID=2624044 RepID=UPI001914F819|nr:MULTISPECIES: alpha/beta hydrolase [unclassified Nitratiruptor]BCD62470.1 2-hydroxy-6-oxohepta-2,4-dienoate hydrolase [Nitratiruptor sp. YY08-13]BCD66406.1 2-hydroxy-6-oxohepta-2,4-dienoate hydrolase [Nitratiruptor sp. YY08-26]
MAQREVRYQDRNFSISYTMEGKGETAIILHGWGSNKEIMQSAFKGCKEFRKIYIDLPGFGRSPNNSILTTADYAQIVEIFLDSLNIPKNIVIGHSFGGKVATLLKPKMLVLLSSAGIVEPKPLRIRAKIALFKLLKPFGIGRLRNFFIAQDAKGMSQNMYETFKNVVNEDFRSSFASFNGKALIFWGKDDKATSLQSGKEIAKLIKNSSFYPLQGDHYFFLHQAPFICQTIKEEYEKL